MVNYVIPVAGVLPLPSQIYLRDHSPLFKVLDPRSAVSASAIYLLVLGLMGLGDIVTGTILADGLSITYPFPQKEFGEEVIRQMPLIELGRQSTVILFTVLFLDSILRLYFNHFHDRPMGFLGSGRAVLGGVFSLFGGQRDNANNVVNLQERLALEQGYQLKIAEIREETQQRGDASFQRFLERLESRGNT